VSKEIRIGLIVVAAGFILYYGFNYLKGIDFFSNTSKYYVLYENVDGLKRSNPVIVNGLAVGKVSDIDLLQKNSNLILVEITIDQDIVLGDSTIAALSNSDFLGSKAIVLDIGDISKELKPRDTLIAYVDRGISEYIASVEPITSNLTITISRINEILLGLQGSGQKVNKTLDDLEKTLEAVNNTIYSNREELNRTIISTRELIENANDKITQLGPIMQKGNGLLDSLNNLELSKSLEGVNQLISQLNSTLLLLENQEGTVGKLMHNDSLYNSLNKLLIDMDKLVIHFNNYPKDFMAPLGRKNKKLEGLPESDQ
jgi:phospholipid/cholesterol/gamma-HCH transport system substrate-binding protein